jgi:hypothetical protein
VLNSADFHVGARAYGHQALVWVPVREAKPDEREIGDEAAVVSEETVVNEEVVTVQETVVGKEAVMEVAIVKGEITTACAREIRSDSHGATHAVATGGLRCDR